jgi:hypothetical protein
VFIVDFIMPKIEADIEDRLSTRHIGTGVMDYLQNQQKARLHTKTGTEATSKSKSYKQKQQEQIMTDD